MKKRLNIVILGILLAVLFIVQILTFPIWLIVYIFTGFNSAIEFANLEEQFWKYVKKDEYDRL